MTNTPTPEPDTDDDVLAGEFVLGVLSDAERDVVQTTLGNNPAFAARVAEWESRMSPLLQDLGEAPVSERVWHAIETNLFDSQISKNTFWQSISVWRWLTAGVGTIAATSLAALVLISPVRQPAPLVAALQPVQTASTVFTRINRSTGHISIDLAGVAVGTDQVPELWLIPTDGVPRSLGALKKQGTTVLAITAALNALLKPDLALAISLEPIGGSPTGKPTGPIVAIGKMHEI